VVVRGGSEHNNIRFRLTENNHRTILNKFEYADLHKIIIIIIVRKVIIYNLCVYL
jgi:hypothetical protein